MITRHGWWAVAACIVACGHRDEPRPVAAPVGTGSATHASAPPPTPAAPAALSPARDLLAAVPADAAFAFVTLEPSDLPARLVAEIDARALREAAASRMALPDPIARIKYAAWAELAATLGQPDPLRALGLGGRFAIYTAGALPVVRVELADPAAAARAIGRVMKAAGQPGAGPTWIVDGGSRALLVALAGDQLVVAHGPRDAIHASSARLVAAAATPITEPALRKLAADHGLDPRGIGWIDPSRFATLLETPGTAADFDDLAPACRTETLAMLRSLPRATFGVSELGPNRTAIALTVGLDGATADALAAAAKAAPTLPATLAGHPMFAMTLVAPPPALRDAWLATIARLDAACGTTSSALGPPWNDLRSAEVVLYDAILGGQMPRGVDALVGISSPRLEAIADQLAKTIPFKLPADGGAFVAVRTDALFGLVPALSIARRGSTLVAVTGPTSRSSVAAIASHDDAPLFRLAFDVARFRGPDAARPSDDQLYVASGPFADEAGLTRALGTRFSAVSFTVAARSGELRVELAAAAGPHVAPPRPRSDPRLAVRDDCRTILRHALAATAPALAKLGVVDDLDELATTYTTSIEATRAIGDCAKLTAAERRCLLAAADPIVAAPVCAPPTDGFGDSKLALPPLFSFFGPDPLAPRLHPRVDGAAMRAKLVGTWQRTDGSETETWQIDAAGDVVATRLERGGGAPKTQRFKLGLDEAGVLDEIEGTGAISHSTWFMPAPDQFFEGGSDEIAPIAAADHFIVPITSGYLVREPAGCTVITREGALVAATCKATAGELAVTYTPPCAPSPSASCEHAASYTFYPGWVVAKYIVGGKPFVRMKP